MKGEKTDEVDRRRLSTKRKSRRSGPAKNIDEVRILPSSRSMILINYSTPFPFECRARLSGDLDEDGFLDARELIEVLDLPQAHFADLMAGSEDQRTVFGADVGV